jgi:hypothetical protein
MSIRPPTSRTCAAALAFGAASLVAGFMALGARDDRLLLAVALCAALALSFAVCGWWAVRRSAGRLRGGALAAWGVGLPAGGFCLAFLLLPHV